MSERVDVGAAARVLHAHLTPGRDAMLADVATLVGMDTPSDGVEALVAAAAWLEAWLAPLGRVTATGAADGRRHLLVETPGATARSPLLLCHYDTVWPLGTAAAWPFEAMGDVATGPGVFDMKASIVCARHALLALRECGLPCEARLHLSADEELGNPSSRDRIVELARDSVAVLVLEPPLDDGRLKTARKGRGSARITVRGRAAHAGVAPERGINAIEEAARLVGALRELAAAVPGSTITVGRIAGGGALNVVPEHAEIGVDVRAWSSADLSVLCAGIEALRPEHADARLEAVVTVDRPPLERRPSTARLLKRCRAASEAVGLTVREGRTGGGSEANLVQVAGAPTLDGLGVRGAGPHTREERIELTHLLPQTAVIGALVAASGAPADV